MKASELDAVLIFAYKFGKNFQKFKTQNENMLSRIMESHKDLVDRLEKKIMNLETQLADNAKAEKLYSADKGLRGK